MKIINYVTCEIHNGLIAKTPSLRGAYTMKHIIYTIISSWHMLRSYSTPIVPTNPKHAHNVASTPCLQSWTTATVKYIAENVCAPQIMFSGIVD